MEFLFGHCSVNSCGLGTPRCLSAVAWEPRFKIMLGAGFGHGRKVARGDAIEQFRRSRVGGGSLI